MAKGDLEKAIWMVGQPSCGYEVPLDVLQALLQELQARRAWDRSALLIVQHAADEAFDLGVAGPTMRLRKIAESCPALDEQ